DVYHDELARRQASEESFRDLYERKLEAFRLDYQSKLQALRDEYQQSMEAFRLEYGLELRNLEDEEVQAFDEDLGVVVYHPIGAGAAEQAGPPVGGGEVLHLPPQEGKSLEALALPSSSASRPHLSLRGSEAAASMMLTEDAHQDWQRYTALLDEYQKKQEEFHEEVEALDYKALVETSEPRSGALEEALFDEYQNTRT
ncbi:unnamed protein product, partial [Amoebophrya sp. A25]